MNVRIPHFMFFPSREREPVAGISITEETLGFLFLKKEGDKTTAVHLNEHTFGEGVIQNGIVTNKEELLNAIKEVLPPASAARLKSRKVIVSVPESIVHYTNFLVPKMLRGQRLEGSIIAYLEQHSPLPIEKLYYDWEEYPLSKKQKMIFVAFAERDTIDVYLEVVRQAGCHPIAVEGEFLSVRRLFPMDTQTARVLLLMGRRRVNFLILQGPIVSFSRSLAWKGDTTTLKKESARIVEYYLTERPEGPPIKKFLIISSPDLKQSISDIKTSIEADFKIEAEEVQIALHTKANSILEGVANRAMIPKNKDTYISLMLPGTEELFHEARLLLVSKLANDFIIIVSIILMLIFSGISFYLLPTYEKQKEDQIIRKRAQPSLQEITGLEAHITDFNTLVEPLATIEQTSPDWIVPLTDLIIRMREGMHVKDISMSSATKTAVISGTADDIGFLIDFKSALSFSGIYEGNLSIPFSSFEKDKDIAFSYTLTFRDPSILYPSNIRAQPPAIPSPDPSSPR